MMASKRTSLGNSGYDNRHRIWIWIAVALLQIIYYPGMLEIYFSRVLATWQSAGGTSLGSLMINATKSALCFNDNALPAIVIPAVLIAMEEFAYLNNRSAVDFYGSIPVKANKKYLNTFFGGMLVYIIPFVASCIIAVIIAAGRNAFNADIAASLALSMLFDIMFFLAMYGLTIAVSMFTGNILTAFFGTMFASVYPDLIAYVVSNYRSTFLKSISSVFTEKRFGWSLIENYTTASTLINVDYLSPVDSATIWRLAYPAYIRFLITIIIAGIIAYMAFMKRPAETAGKCLSTNVIAAPLKVLISIPVGMYVGILIYETSNHNMTLMVIALIASTLIMAMLMEALFEFDIHAVTRHMVPAFISLAAALLLFASVKFDWTGYDRFVPKAEDVDSCVLYVPSAGGASIISGYYNHLGCYGDASALYAKDHMFLRSVNEICELNQNSVDNYKKLYSEFGQSTTNVCEFDVLYRMKNGTEKTRMFYVDLSDKKNCALMEKIIGKEFVDGIYQLSSDPDGMVNQGKFSLMYSNGYAYSKLKTDDFRTLRNAWVKDAQSKMIFSTMQNSIPCGMIQLSYKDNFNAVQIPVYDSFENTLSWLEDHNVDLPKKINPDDIASIAVSYFAYLDSDTDSPQAREGVTYTAAADEMNMTEDSETEEDAEAQQAKNAVFSDPKEIEQIVPAIYPQMLSTGWNLQSDTDQNYSVDVTLKSDVTYKTDSWVFYCGVYSGQMPKFVDDKIGK